MNIRHFISTVFLLFIYSAVSAAQTNNILSMPDIAALGGSSVTLPFYLENEQDITAVQFTIELPDGCTLTPTTAKLTERSNEHLVTFREIGAQQYMCMIFSQSNKPFIANSGKLFTIELNVSETLQEGEEYEFNISDVVLAANDGNNMFTGANIGKLRIMKSCDLIADNLSTDKNSYAPEEQITLSWSVSNIGEVATSGGWKENIFLVGENGYEKLIGSTYYNQTIESNNVISRQATVTIPQIIGIDGTAHAKIQIIPYSDSGERDEHQSNNTALSVQEITLSKNVYINIPASKIDEDTDNPVKCTLSRSGNHDTTETFTFTIEGNDGRLLFPTSVDIAKGTSEAIFYIAVNNNEIIDRDNNVSISVINANYEETKTNITVVDDEFPTLSLNASSVEVDEGGNLTFTITNEITEEEDINVNINCEAPSRFTYPTQVVIPQNENKTTFTVTAINDENADISKDITFTATAQKHNAGEAIVILHDDDIPQLELEIHSSEVSEGAGINGINGTLRRLSKTEQDIVIEIYDNSNNELFYTNKRIEMKSGVEAVEISLGTIDNSTVDGNREVEITAAVYIESCSCNASSTSVGVVTKTITILDNDGPTLNVTANNSTCKEGGEATITISRNTTTENELSVTVTSNNDEILQYEHNVIIAAGESSIELPIVIGSNDIADDSQIITITASAGEHTNGNCWIMVTDQTLPDAQITNITSSESELLTGGTVNISVEVSNSGAAVLKAPAKVEIISKNDGSILKTLYTQNDIEVGNSEILTSDITLPNTLGKYEIMATVNKEQTIKELQYANNTSNVIAINLLPLFSATVTTDRNIYMQGDSIVINGTATGKNTSNSEVEVYIINNGLRETFTATTDSSGSFSVIYKPYTQQIGHFIAGACYPGEKSTEEQVSFDIYGLKLANSDFITCETLIGETYNGNIALLNPGVLELTGVKAEVISKPENCDVTLTPLANIQGGENVALSFELLGHAATAGNNWETIKIRVTTAEEVSLDINLYYYCRSPKGQLQASVSQITTTMIKDVPRDYPITITNTGKGETGKITFALPSWITTATPSSINTLASGETSTVVLRFNPFDDMQLNVPVSGQIGINCSNGNGIPLQYEITPVSESTGQLVIDVCDEYTYYTKEAPHVSGAEIIVKHPTTGAVISQGKTGDDGIYRIELPEGYYKISVTADRHDSYENNILIDPGKNNNITVNLSYQAITIDWKAEEIEIEDEYEFTSTVKYETNVPVPVVEVIWPDELPEEIMTAGTCIVNATITNKGLITAQDVNISLEEADEWETEVLGKNNFDLQPSTTVVVPVKITIKQTNANRIIRKDKVLIDTKWFKCYIKTYTLTYWDCGTDRKWHLYEKQIKFPVCESKSDNKEPNKSTTGGINWPKPKPIPIGDSIPPYKPLEPVKIDSIGEPPLILTSEYKGCIPCIGSFFFNLLKCIPTVGTAVGLVEDANDCFDAIDTNERWSDMLRDCPFTSILDVLPNNILPMVDVAQDLANFGTAQSNPNATQEEKDEAFNRLKESGFDLLTGFYNMPNIGEIIKEGTDMAEAIKDNAERLSEAVDKTKEGDFSELHKEAHALLEKGSEVIENVNESIDKLEDSGILDKAGEVIKDVYGSTEKLDEFSKKASKWRKVAKRIGKYLCIVDLLAPCDKTPGTEVASLARASINTNINSTYNIKRTKSTNGSVNNSAMEEYQIMLRHIVNASDAQDNIRLEILGKDVWGDVDWIEFLPLYFYLTNSEYIVYNEATEILRPRNISKEDFKALLERWNSCFNENKYEELIDLEYIKKQIQIINESSEYLRNSGYTTYSELFTAKSNEIIENLTEESSSVCSSITLQFSQTMVMTRQAFRGTLTVFNGNEATAMENIRLNLELRNEDGVLATSKEFQINAESLDKFTGELSIGSEWSLAANETGIATVLFIPTKYAAPTESKVYSFGGTLTYIDPFTGTEVTRNLFPVKLTVKPSPNLNMTYFMQRDIYGDDPLTKDIIEKIEPAEFSLLIHNIGYGDATNVHMTTKQPEIIDNEKGLAVKFNIVSSQLNGGNETLSLGGSIPTDFGTIPAHSTVFAQWWLESTLLGHFTEYDIEANHITSYGNEDLSLLNEVTIHELIKSVGYTDETGNNITGFITNDIVDANDMPDMIYLSNGNIEKVNVTDNIVIEKINDNVYNFTVTPDSMGWNYGYIKDPTLGKQKIKEITRSDGTNVDLRNIWQTDRILRDGKEHLYENRIHIADKTDLSQVIYTVTFEAKPQKRLEVESFDNIPAEGEIATSAISEVYIKFNKGIDSSTFTAEDINLSVQGEDIATENIVINKTDASTYVIDLSAISSPNGFYVLTVHTDNITDDEGFKGEDGKSASWIQFLENKVNVSINITPENGGTVNHTSGEYEYNDNMTLIASPNEGYKFKNWSINNETVSNETTYEKIINKEFTINANFTPLLYNITITTDETTGSINGAGSGIYEYGEKLTLSIIPANDYCLDGWYINGEKISSDNTYIHTVDGAADIEVKLVNVVTTYSIKVTLNSIAGSKLISNFNYERLATFSANFATSLPEGIAAFYATSNGVQEEFISLIEYDGSVLPANEGFILAGNSESALMIGSIDTPELAVENKLGNTANGAKVLTAGECYLLGNGNDGPGFYACGGGVLAKNKAYLNISALTNMSRSVVIRFPGTTETDNVITENNNDNIAIYDLFGRKVEKPSRGIYIVNGKKIYKR